MPRRIGLDISAAALIAAAALCDAPVFARAPPTDTPTAARAIPTATQSTTAPCFSRKDWRGGWRATPDARTIYIRVSTSVYRLELQSSYSLLKDPFAILLNSDSADTICTPLDFRLTISNRVGVEQWPIVTRMTRLTRAEAAALPRKLRP